MNTHFEILKTTRTNVLNAIEGLSNEQLNTIPEGFNNSIIWNVAHIVVTQQLLCYKVSGLPMHLEDSFIDRFKKGSSAEGTVSEEEVLFIKEKMMSLIDQIEKDYAEGIFKTYTQYPTSYNFVLNSAEDAIKFNNVHEGLHFGYIMAQKKLV